MPRYKVELRNVREFEVEANDEGEAISAAHDGWHYVENDYVPVRSLCQYSSAIVRTMYEDEHYV